MANNHAIEYTATPTISGFHGSDALFRGIKGPFGSGKSTACSMEIMKRAQEMSPSVIDGKRKSRWAVVRNTYRELMDSTVKTWFEWFPESIFGVFKKNEMTHFVRFGDVELDVCFRALDKPDDIKKLLSVEYTAAWLNEAREIPKAILDAMEGRIGRYPRRADVPHGYWAGIIADTNPPDTRHWWYYLAETPHKYVDHSSPMDPEQQIEEIREQYRFWHQPSGLSPEAENVENLRKNYYERLAVGKSPEWVKVYVHGQYGFVVDGRPIYPEYVDSTHCSADLKPLKGVEILRGWDFGLTPCAVFAQFTPRGQLIVFDELVSESMGIDRFSDNLIQYCKIHYPNATFLDFGDPAGETRAQTDEKTCFQILHSKSVRIEKGAEDLTTRHESVRKMLNAMVDGRPGFQLHPRCELLRQGFMGGYQYRRMRITGDERFMETPDKNDFSHPHDALQYLVSGVLGETLVDPFASEPEMDYEESFSTASFRGRSVVTGY